MKLPTAINTGVQSLGRYDANAPIRVAQAESAATRAWTGTIERAAKGFGDLFVAQEAAKGKLALREMQEKHRLENTQLQAVMENTESFIVGDESTPEIINEWAKTNGNKTGERLSSSDIMMDVMSAHRERTKDEAYTVLGEHGNSNALKAEYLSSMVPQWESAIQSATKTKAVRQQDALVAELDARLDSAIQAGDIQTAMGVIDDGEEMFVYTPEEAIKKRSELPQKIDFQNYSRALQSDDPALLEAVEETIWTGNNALTNEQRTRLANAYSSKIDSLVAAHDKAVKAERTRASKDLQLSYMTRIVEDGPMEWGELDLTGMDPAEAQATLKFNQAAMEKRGKESDPRVMTTLQGEVLDLAIPTETPMPSRKASVQMRIMTALSDMEISAGDARNLIGQLNTMEAIPYKSQSYMRAQDKIYTVLVGGGKASLAFFNNDPINKLNALQMEEALIQAMRQGGETFDPEAWVNQNIAPFALKQVNDNNTKLNKQRIKAVIEKNPDGTVNREKTYAKLRQSYESGIMSAEDVKAAEEYIEQWISVQEAAATQ